MKSLRTFTVLGLAVLLSGCLEATLVEERPVRRRTVGYHDGHDYHRSDYHDSGHRSYRHYDDDDDDDRVYETRRVGPKPGPHRPGDRVLIIRP